MNLPPYPKYKPSGVEWLGDVPEQWGALPLKRLSRRYAGGTPDRANATFWEEGSIPWINSGAVNQAIITEPSELITPEGYANSSARWVPDRALVMALAGQGKTKGMVAQTAICTTCNQSMAAIVPSERMEPRYLYWLLVSQYRQIREMAGGEQRDGLNLEIVGLIPMLEPSRSEQRAIADFLDERTGKLDALAEKKRALIEKLKEKRSALISRTVTKGLPAEAAAQAGLPTHPKLTPSGIPWLGNIPENWIISKAGHYIKILSGFAFPSAGFTQDESDTKLLRGANVGVSRIRWDDTVRWERVEGDGLNRFQLNAGTLVVGMDRPWISEGVRVAIISEADLPCLLLQRVVAITPAKRLLTAHLFRILSSQIFVDYFTPDTTGVSVPHISPDQLSNFTIPVPPLSEQTAIADYLDRETAKIDRMIEKVEAALEKLAEYRTALITAAVTGKIDVRQTRGLALVASV